MCPPEIEDELARIDREWDRERERYLITSRYGRRRYVPSETAAALMAVGVLVVGGGCIALASGAQGDGGVLLLIGWAVVVVGLGISLYQYLRARRYGTAYRAYRRRRSAAQERQQMSE